ncbi:DgyrCDS9984 [Dimorphilus gyrociliatus]|uniref:DgyrCDS9984 n=1 Tax=Dimorphilus gyrociliatus TaxID=2664684 RepID=A0A7I8VZ33_9ANNE|nr:DgyrCDS9984 [Dimorphilus gyrociliatus]
MMQKMPPNMARDKMQTNTSSDPRYKQAYYVPPQMIPQERQTQPARSNSPPSPPELPRDSVPEDRVNLQHLSTPAEPVAVIPTIQVEQKRESSPEPVAQNTPERSETRSEDDEEKKRKKDNKDTPEEDEENIEEDDKKRKGSALVETFKREREFEEYGSQFKQENSFFVQNGKSTEKVVKKPKEKFNFQKEAEESSLDSNERKINYRYRKRNRRLIPFFIQKNYSTVKPPFDLDDPWFIMADENLLLKSSRPFQIIQRELEQMLEDEDELINIFDETKQLKREYSNADGKFRNKIKYLKDLRSQSKNLYGMTTNGGNGNDSDVYTTILNKVASKASQFSSKWVKSDPKVSASKLFNNFSKTTPSHDEKANQNIEKCIEERAWAEAKRHPIISDQNAIKKREEDRKIFIENLMIQCRYEGLTRGKFHMPVADFAFAVPVPKRGETIMTGMHSLKMIYCKHWEQTTNKPRNVDGLERTLSSLEFIDPNTLELPNDKLTGNKVLIGMGKNAIYIGGYMDESLIKEMDEFSGEHAPMKCRNSDGKLGVVVKLYRNNQGKGLTAIDLVKEATVLDYVNRNVPYAGPTLMGFVSMSYSDEYLPIGIVTALIGDPDNFEVATLDRILLQEVISREERGDKILEDWRWVKILLKLTKILQRLHRKLIIINNLKLNNIVMRYVEGRGWSCPRPTNFAKAHMLSGVRDCLFDNKIPTKHAGGDQIFKKAVPTTFETNISQLGKIIRDVNLALSLGLEGIVEHCQSSTQIEDYWSTCRIIEALEGAMTDLKLQSLHNRERVKSNSNSKEILPLSRVQIDSLKSDKDFITRNKRKNGYDDEKSKTSTFQRLCPHTLCPQWRCFNPKSWIISKS